MASGRYQGEMNPPRSPRLHAPSGAPALNTSSQNNHQPAYALFSFFSSASPNPRLLAPFLRRRSLRKFVKTRCCPNHTEQGETRGSSRPPLTRAVQLDLSRSFSVCSHASDRLLRGRGRKLCIHGVVRAANLQIIVELFVFCRVCVRLAIRWLERHTHRDKKTLLRPCCCCVALAVPVLPGAEKGYELRSVLPCSLPFGNLGASSPMRMLRYALVLV